MLFTVAPIFVFADCNEYRLDQQGSAFDKIPVYNQLDYRGVDANICYAIASSQLVDEYRYRKGDSLKQISSPLSLAIGYKEYSKDQVNKNYSTETISARNITDSIFGGGFIEETIAAVDQIKVCDQYAIEKEAGLTQADSFTKLSTKSAQQFVESTLLDENTTKVKSFFKLDFLKAVKSELENRCEENQFVLNNIHIESFSAGDYLDDLAKLMQIQSNPSIPDDEKLKLRKKFAQKYDKSKITQIYKEKISTLLKQKIPVGIGYFMKVLRKKSGTSDFAAHASIITGQRQNSVTGVCELLVRDSYGSNCKDQRGENRYELACENGSVWVPADDLLGEISKISWIP